MSIDFHRLIEAIDNNRLIIIDYIDYIDCLPMIDFLRLGTPGCIVNDVLKTDLTNTTLP